MSQGIKQTRKSYIKVLLGLPWWLSGRESANAGDRFKSLIWDGSTCYRATKLVHHNYRTCALEPKSCNC